jgi:hypothetical protein
MPPTVSISDAFNAVMSTLVLPLAVLAMDYFIRAKVQAGTWNELIASSGPDCCILSLGTTGAIFLDPHVRSIAGMKSPLFIIFLMLFLIFMRFACIKTSATAGLAAPASLGYGVTSLLVIFFVMVIGYGYDIYKASHA